MKRFLAVIIIIIPLLCAAQKKEQTVIVYEVGGNVTYIKNRKPVVKKQQFSLQERINIPENGFIKLLDKNQQKMYTLKDKCSGKISTLIANQKSAGRNLTKQYFAYVLKSLTRNDTDLAYAKGLATTAFRNDADSLLCDIDSLQNVVDSLNDVIVTLTTDSVKRK
jgi:hypothetical protein